MKTLRNFKIVLLLAAMMLISGFIGDVFPSGESPPGKPLSFKSTDFPVSMVILKQTDNPWLENGDYIYSVYQDKGLMFACWDIQYKSKNVIIKAFGNDDYPVKTGFDKDEAITWGVYSEGCIFKLKLIEYVWDGLTFGIGTVTDVQLYVNDNRYYSLDPLWPDIGELKITKPLPDKWYQMYELMSYGLIMPKYIDGSPWINITMGEAIIKPHKYFNSTKIKLTKADVARGYLVVTIQAKPLINSNFKSTSKQFRIFWT